MSEGWTIDYTDGAFRKKLIVTLQSFSNYDEKTMKWTKTDKKCVSIQHKKNQRERLKIPVKAIPIWIRLLQKVENDLQEMGLLERRKE